MSKVDKKHEWLTPQEFEAIMQDAFGNRGWKKCISEATGVSPSNFHRYMTGDITPIPQYMCLIARLIQGYRLSQLTLPHEFFGDIPVKPIEESD